MMTAYVQCKKCGVTYECEEGTKAHRNMLCHRCKFGTKAPVILTKKQYTHEEVMRILHDHDIPYEFDDSRQARERAKIQQEQVKRFLR